MDRRLGVALGGAAMVVLLTAGCSSAGTETADEPTTQPQSTVSESAEPQPADDGSGDDSAAAPAGGYIDYATYQADPAAYSGGDVVLFFNASWCPTCKEAASNLSGAAYPAGLTVVSVDYDDNTGLRREYGVTVQHTFVQVDPSGNEIAKWTGSTTLDDIEGQLA